MKQHTRPAGHSWADIGKTEPLSREEILFDAVCFKVLQTPDGQKLLAYLHEITTFQRNSPNDSDGALRELEAQRRLVAIIEARNARYLKGTKTDGGRTRTRRNRREEAG